MACKPYVRLVLDARGKDGLLLGHRIHLRDEP